MRTLKEWDRYAIVELTRQDKEFYYILGWFFGSRQIARELGMPIYDDENRVWVVTMFAGDPVSCGSIEIKGHKAAIKSAWVKPEHRGKGIYTRMLSERLRVAQDASVKVITATATEASRKALLKHGFEHVGMRGKYYLMRKEMIQK